MTDTALTWLAATWALIGAALLQPPAAWVVGALAGGYAAGASKNRTALVELSRALVIGVSCGFVTWCVQQLLVGGIG